jgi:hypothetical protein
VAAQGGQAAVDLPDPLDKLDDETAAGADDLLRQLAGDEIDRMLGDAPADAPALTPDAPAPLAGLDAVQSQLDTLFHELNAADIPTVPHPQGESAAAPVDAASADAAAAVAREVAAPEPAPPADPHTEAALDALFSELSSAKLPEIDSAAPAIPGAAAAEAPPAEVELEQAVLAATAPASAADAAQEIGAELAEAVAAHDQQEALDRGDRLPWYLLPLLWINAPFRSLNDSVREAVGTVGIVTTANALAVLLYVMLFR